MENRKLSAQGGRFLVGGARIFLACGKLDVELKMIHWILQRLAGDAPSYRCRRGLRWGDASRMDEPGDVAQCRGGFNKGMYGFARGHVHGRDAHLVTGVLQNFGRCVGIVPAHVSQQEMLADTDAPCDCLADLTWSDDDNDVSHNLRIQDGGDSTR